MTSIMCKYPLPTLLTRRCGRDRWPCSCRCLCWPPWAQLCLVALLFLSCLQWCRLSPGAAGSRPSAQQPVLPVQRLRPDSLLTTWTLGGIDVRSNGSAWSATGKFTGKGTMLADSTRIPSAVIAPMTVRSSPSAVGSDGMIWMIVVEVQLPTGQRLSLNAKLYGARLALVLSTVNTTGPTVVQTMADYNAMRYGEPARGIKVSTPPKLFPIMDRFISGDDNLLTWTQGLELLTQLGMHGINVETGNTQRGYPNYNAFVRKALLATSQNTTSGALYNAPGTAPYSGRNTIQFLKQWASAVAAPFRAAGFLSTQMTAFALADEPGWSFPGSAPEMFYPQIKVEWQSFLRRQNLTPGDFGAVTWEEVIPNSTRWGGLAGPQWGLDSSAAKLRYYYTARFSALSSAQAFASATDALQQSFYPGLPVYINLNNFAGRSYTPTATKSPNSATLSPDWFDCGRAKAATLLWTEDWFNDAQAPQWSYYLSRLRSASRLASGGGVSYGGYVVPRDSGQSADGLLLKVLSVIGSGAKALKYFLFGPEYLFPGNCYSEVAVGSPYLYKSMAEAHSMIGDAEATLWPAIRVTSAVAILFPRSSQVWDGQAHEHPSGIVDNGNSAMDDLTVDYMAECYGIYSALALQRNVPVDFIDEDGVLDEIAMARLKVVFVVGPNVPNATMNALVKWVQKGGTVITSSNAATMDEIDQPSAILNGLSGLTSHHNGRTPRGSHLQGPFGPAMKKGQAWRGGGFSMDQCGPGNSQCYFTALGEAGFFDNVTGATTRWSTIASWVGSSGGGSATRWAPVGSGAHVHFAWMPGITHTFGGELSVANMLANLTRTAPPPVTVSREWIETPLLHGPTGSVVALLNWTAHGQDMLKHGTTNSLRTTTATRIVPSGPSHEPNAGAASPLVVNVTLGYEPKSVRSVKKGPLAVTAFGNGCVQVTVTVAAADFLLFQK